MSDFKESYSHTAKVERYANDDLSNALRGEPDDLEVITASVNCLILPIDSKDKRYAMALEEAIQHRKMFCDTTDIQIKDIVTNLSTNELFTVKDIKNYDLADVLIILLKGR